jgi:hypothetical protein
MLTIMVVVLAMFSPVQAIIAAEAGVNAKVENIAAVIKILISTLPENETSIILANEIRFRHPMRFQRNKFFCAAMQRNPVSRHELAVAETQGGLNAKDLAPLISQRPADSHQQASKRIPDQCFDRSPIAPVAISASHDALPRSGAWHL